MTSFSPHWQCPPRGSRLGVEVGMCARAGSDFPLARGHAAPAPGPPSSYTTLSSRLPDTNPQSRRYITSGTRSTGTQSSYHHFVCQQHLQPTLFTLAITHRNKTHTYISLDKMKFTTLAILASVAIGANAQT